MSEMEEKEIVELETENGESVSMQVERYFYYNGEEFVLLSEVNAPDDHYIMKVNPLPDENGEEMEEFVPVDDELMDHLIHIVETTFDIDEEA